MASFKTFGILNILVIYYLARQNDLFHFVWLMGVTILAQIHLWTIYKLVIYPRLLSPLRRIPEPKSSRVFTGESFNIFVTPDINTSRRWINETPNNGLIRFRTIWGIDSLIITSPELLSEVLVSKAYEYIKRPYMAKILALIMGNGLIFAEGAEHKRQRKHLMPPFAYSRIKELYPTFWHRACEATTSMTDIVQDEKVLQVNDWASRVLLDIIGEAGMGQSFRAISNPEDNELYGAYSAVFRNSSKDQARQIMQRLARDFVCSKIPYFERWIPLDPTNPMVHSIRLIRRLTRDIIVSGKASMSLSAKDGDRKQMRHDMMSAALGSRAFSDQELVDQMMTFLLAGHESSASALTMACYFLCKRPEVQTKLRHEIRLNLPPPSESSSIDAEQIRSLPYLQAVCEEVLRIAPPVPISGRIATVDTYIGDQLVPKGTTLILALAAINGSKGIWGPDALEFRPERWIEGNVPESPYANMTFLHGPRSCIGRDFAKGSFTCVLAAWVGRFQMEFEDPQYEAKFAKASLNLRLEGGMGINMRRIEGW